MPGPFVLSAARAAAVERAMRAAAAAPSWRYPWRDLDADLRQRGRASFPCVGYGSLVNAASASRTLGTASQVLVVAFGVRRLFNYEMPDGASQYGPPVERRARAALNVRATGRHGDMVNGVLFDVALEDVPAFREREIGYDLVPVACLKWNRPDGEPFLAYILSCPDEERAGAVRTRADIEPHRAYYAACRDGAASCGDEFLHVWLATTFLADGITPMTEWER